MNHQSSVLFMAAVAVLGTAFAGCTTARRTTDLVVEHHVGMVRQAAEVLSGAAEEREQRSNELLAKLDRDRESLKAEGDPSILVRRLRQHVAIQDAILAELMASGHAGHHGHCRAHKPGKDETGAHKGPVTSEISALVWKASTAADHGKIADYYLREAKDLRLRAAQHRSLAERYRGLAPTIDATEQAAHCEDLAGSFLEAAKRYDELAAYHRKVAAGLANGS